jgi:hypothetical protein
MSYTKYIPEDYVSLLKFSVLLNPSRKAFTNSWILVWELATWKALIPVILCHPKVVIQESSSPEKLGIRTC